MAGHSAIPAGVISLATAIFVGEVARRQAMRIGASADQARIAGTCAHGLVTLVAGLSVNALLVDVAGPVTTGAQTVLSTCLYDQAVSLLAGY